jgi:hypothetical protein
MRPVFEKSMFKAVAIVGAAGAIVLGMQVHLWEAHAKSRPGVSAASMSSFINDLHSSGYAKNLPIQVLVEPL